MWPRWLWTEFLANFAMIKWELSELVFSQYMSWTNDFKVNLAFMEFESEYYVLSWDFNAEENFIMRIMCYWYSCFICNWIFASIGGNFGICWNWMLSEYKPEFWIVRLQYWCLTLVLWLRNVNKSKWRLICWLCLIL